MGGSLWQGSLETGTCGHSLGHLQQLSSSEGETRIQQRHDPSRRPHLVLALLLQERLPKDRDKGGLGMSWLGAVEEGNKSEVVVQSSEVVLWAF